MVGPSAHMAPHLLQTRDSQWIHTQSCIVTCLPTRRNTCSEHEETVQSGVLFLLNPLKNEGIKFCKDKNRDLQEVSETMSILKVFVEIHFLYMILPR